jgi:hypothetical protein
LDRLEDEADLARLEKSRHDVKLHGATRVEQVVSKNVLERARRKNGPSD